MSISLFDYDFTRSEQLYFNLELMKQSWQLKKKREIVVISPLFAPEKFSETRVFQDFTYDSTFFRFSEKDKVSFYGKRFFDKKVTEDLAYENCQPDVMIYDKLRSYVKPSQKTRFTTLINGEHIRLSLDGKTVNPNVEKQFRSLNFKKRVCFLYDYDVSSINGAAAALCVLQEKYNLSFETKFPLILTEKDDIAKWKEVRFATDAKVVFENATDEMIFEASKNPKFVKFHLDYKLAPERTRTNEFLKDYLPKIFKHTLFLRENELIIPLNIENLYLVAPEYRRLISLFSNFIRHKDFDSFIHYLRRRGSLGFKTTCTREQARDALQKLALDNYQLFTELYTETKVKFTEGEFIYDRT